MPASNVMGGYLGIDFYKYTLKWIAYGKIEKAIS